MRDITEAEMEIMQALWTNGPLKPADIVRAMPGKPHNSTVRTLLRILVEKKHVARSKAGKAFVYRAKTMREGELARSFSRLVDAFAGGSPSLLLRHLVEARSLSQRDIEELREIAKPAASPKNRKGATVR